MLLLFGVLQKHYTMSLQSHRDIFIALNQLQKYRNSKVSISRPLALITCLTNQHTHHNVSMFGVLFIWIFRWATQMSKIVSLGKQKISLVMSWQDSPFKMSQNASTLSIWVWYSVSINVSHLFVLI
jgi:hypothetical protein